MKLYTHNMMISPVKGITKNYPLGIEADAVEERDVDFDAQFIKHILPTIDYPVLLASALQVNMWCSFFCASVDLCLIVRHVGHLRKIRFCYLRGFFS